MAGSCLGGRLPLLHPSDLSAAARKLYDQLIERQRQKQVPYRIATDEGEFIGPFNACLHAPETGMALLEMHDAEGKASSLTARLREIVILSVGAAWSSPYELYAHRLMASQAGFAPNIIDALSQGVESNELATDELMAQRFTLELMRNRQISDETFQASEKALGRDNVLAIVFLAATYASTSTILNAFAVPAPSTDTAIQL